MNKLLMICVILTIILTSVLSLAAGVTVTPKDSKVMIVNAYSKDIFVRITDPYNNVILQTSAIAPEDMTYMLSTSKTGFFFISYKFSETGDWLPFYDYDDEDDYLINLQSGLVCCIVIDGYCDIDEHTLVLPVSSSPLICFCNLSTTTLNRMEIGTDYLIDFVAYTLDIKPLGMTDFTAIDAGNYGLSWATVASAANDEYSWLSDDNDAFKLFPFENNNLYVYCVHENDASKATLFNITP